MIDKSPEQSNETDALFVLAKEQKREVDQLIELIGIPEALASKGLAGAVFVIVLRLDEIANQAIGMREVSQYRSDFDELCKAFPHVSVECFRLLGIASVSIDMFFRDTNPERNIRYKVMDLMTTSKALGGAYALLPASLGYLSAKIQAERKAVLSAAGMNGADIKHAPTRELEKWALERASKLNGNDKQIANTLAKTIPDHLKDASADPARFIYDKLRLSKKCNELIRLASHS